jgi:hypothetical protein
MNCEATSKSRFDDPLIGADQAKSIHTICTQPQHHRHKTLGPKAEAIESCLDRLVTQNYYYRAKSLLSYDLVLNASIAMAIGAYKLQY